MGPNNSHSGCTTTTNHPSSSHLIFRQPALLFPAGATNSDDAKPPPRQVPHHPEPPLAFHPTLPSASTDDARGLPTIGSLARSPALFCRGEGVTPLPWVMMIPQTQELMKIMWQTSLLLREPGTLDQLGIEALFFLLIRIFLHFSFLYFSIFFYFYFLYLYFILYFIVILFSWTMVI